MIIILIEMDYPHSQKKAVPVSKIEYTCSQCKIAPIQGTYYRCNVCHTYYLCKFCYDKGYHGMHQFLINEPGKEPLLIEEEKHYGVMCNNCRVTPILGARYKCGACPDYDLCPTCKITNVHSHHPFYMKAREGVFGIILPPTNKLIGHKEDPPTQKCVTYDLRKGNPSTHLNTKCDVCGVNPIQGHRYSCNVCIYFTMCDTCQTRGEHSYHPSEDNGM